MSYAKTTSVSPERSKAEIEKLILRYGASHFVSGWGDGKAMLGFRCHERMLRFELVFPSPKDKKFTRHHKWNWRSLTDIQAAKKYEQEVRRLWRALALVIKAKLESVESGIETFEHAFAMNIVMPDGKTFAAHALPAIEMAYETGRMPPLLLPGASE